jgi:hypothetical protein
MMWVPKGSMQVQADVIPTFRARTTSKPDPKVISKRLLDKDKDKKAGPYSFDRTWSSRKQPRGQKFAYKNENQW